MTQNEEKKQTIKTDPEMMLILAFIDVVIITIFPVHEKAEET